MNHSESIYVRCLSECRHARICMYACTDGCKYVCMYACTDGWMDVRMYVGDGPLSGVGPWARGGSVGLWVRGGPVRGSVGPWVREGPVEIFRLCRNGFWEMFGNEHGHSLAKLMISQYSSIP